jgi:hypothetical protein
MLLAARVDLTAEDDVTAEQEQLLSTAAIANAADADTFADSDSTDLSTLQRGGRDRDWRCDAMSGIAVVLLAVCGAPVESRGVQVNGRTILAICGR